MEFVCRVNRSVRLRRVAHGQRIESATVQALFAAQGCGADAILRRHNTGKGTRSKVLAWARTDLS
jgi:hypothetical protein